MDLHIIEWGRGAEWSGAI